MMSAVASAMVRQPALAIAFELGGEDLIALVAPAHRRRRCRSVRAEQHEVGTSASALTMSLPRRIPPSRIT